MKKFEFIVTVDDAHLINVSTVNEGFNAVELLGLIELKKNDILDQMYNQTEFKRVSKVNGEEFDIIKKEGIDNAEN